MLIPHARLAVYPWSSSSPRHAPTYSHTISVQQPNAPNNGPPCSILPKEQGRRHGPTPRGPRPFVARGAWQIPTVLSSQWLQNLTMAVITITNVCFKSNENYFQTELIQPEDSHVNLVDVGAPLVKRCQIFVRAKHFGGSETYKQFCSHHRNVLTSRSLSERLSICF